jgi:hypothetical protein
MCQRCHVAAQYTHACDALEFREHTIQQYVHTVRIRYEHMALAHATGATLSRQNTLINLD